MWRRTFKPIIITLLMAALLMAAAVFAGCGGHSSTPGRPTPTPTPTPAPTPTPTPAPTPTPTPTPNPSPSISSLSPASAAGGGAAFTLTVNGANFVSASVVEWNGSNRPTTFVNSGQLTAQIGAADIAHSGKANVVVSNPAPGGNSAPVSFTISSSSILYESTRALDGSNAGSANNTPNIWLMNADGTGSTHLTAITVHLFDSPCPILSPSGTKIAFTSTRALDGSNGLNQNATANVWVMNADGSGVAPLTQINVPGGNSGGPVWSPDGSKILYVSQRSL